MGMRLLGKVSVLFFSLVLAAVAAAAPSAVLWERWEQHQLASSVTVSHERWARFLNHYRSEREGVARIGYYRVRDAHRVELVKDYITALSEADVDSMSRREQKAFWINAYNAVTIETILKEMETNKDLKSIREIRSGLLTPGPWDLKLFSVAGEELTLNDIEHRILRPIWRDARIHYAVNCASIGCPDIAAVPYTAGNVERLLEQGARNFINSGRAVFFNEDGDLIVSSIYDWFEDDFGGNEEAVLEHIRQYANADLKEQLENFSSIDDYYYDWNLNL